MPDPAGYDDKFDFMGECVSMRQQEHPDEDHNQSVAICNSMWEDKHAGRGIVIKTHADIESVGMEFVLSDATPDRYGDVILVDGWNLENFSKNPIALFNHDKDFPIGRWENLGVRSNGLRGHLRLAPEGTSARIDEIRKLIDAKILRAVSVGFMPIEFKALNNSNGGQLYTKSELVETSLVSVPANPNALAVAKSLKISDATQKMVFAEQGGPTIQRGTMWKGRIVADPVVRTTTWRGQTIREFE